MIDRILIQILAAPSISPNRKTQPSIKVVDSQILENASSIIPRAESKPKIDERQKSEKSHKRLLKNALEKFTKLTLELKLYRDQLKDSKERLDFDSLWGLDADGNYKRQQKTE
eukprot:gene22792-27800_t